MRAIPFSRRAIHGAARREIDLERPNALTDDGRRVRVTIPFDDTDRVRLEVLDGRADDTGGDAVGG